MVCNILVSPAAFFWISCNAPPPPHPLLGQRCVTSKKRLRGRLATSMRNLKELAQHQNDDHRNADFWPVRRLGSALNFKVL